MEITRAQGMAGGGRLNGMCRGRAAERFGDVSRGAGARRKAVWSWMRLGAGRGQTMPAALEAHVSCFGLDSRRDGTSLCGVGGAVTYTQSLALVQSSEWVRAERSWRGGRMGGRPAAQMGNGWWCQIRETWMTWEPL